jgi:hypothetical protein
VPRTKSVKEVLQKTVARIGKQLGGIDDNQGQGYQRGLFVLKRKGDIVETETASMRIF